jgi:hypothetical protein
MINRPLSRFTHSGPSGGCKDLICHDANILVARYEEDGYGFCLIV